MHSVALGVEAINWNGGQRMTLTKGQTATCTVLQPDQLYGIFFYNSANSDNTAHASINWSNSQPPVSISIPGTTANAGLASLAFVSGTDTQSISVSLPSNGGLNQVDIWLGSVSMPTNTSGLNNSALPADAKQHSFNKYARYFTVPASSWYSLTLVSTITQFISVQFREQKAVVYVLNETSNGLAPGQVINVGPTAALPGAVTLTPVTSQSVTTNLQGDGTQWVWIDADSQQDSASASISLQALS